MVQNDSQQENKSQETDEEYMSISGLLLEMVRVFLLAVIIIIPVRVFLFQPFFVQGSSMEPNFKDGEYLVINEFGYKQTDVGFGGHSFFQVQPFQELERQAPVVFRFPKNEEEFFIKRVIGLPGEAVEIKQGRVVIYNSLYPQGYILDESAYLGPEVLTKDMPRMEIGLNQYVLMGDNRMFSYDSRAFGPVGKEKIIGTVLLRAWPAERFSLY
jgi:signal peptidase I